MINVHDTSGNRAKTRSESNDAATIVVSSLGQDINTAVLEHALKSKSKSLKCTMEYKDLTIN